MPALKRTPGARVISVASAGMLTEQLELKVGVATCLYPLSSPHLAPLSCFAQSDCLRLSKAREEDPGSGYDYTM